MEKVYIKGEYITLSRLLKLSGHAQTGGGAKYIIADGRVRLNGCTIRQRGKKIFPGDIVSLDGKDILKVISG